MCYRKNARILCENCLQCSSEVQIPHAQQVLRNLLRVYKSNIYSLKMRPWLLIMILVIAVGVAVGSSGGLASFPDRPGSGSTNLTSGSGSKSGPPGKGNSTILIYVYYLYIYMKCKYCTTCQITFIFVSVGCRGPGAWCTWRYQCCSNSCIIAWCW